MKPRQFRLTVVAKESFGLFVFCCHEGSYEIVSNGCQQDHQEDNLSLMEKRQTRQRERKKWGGGYKKWTL